MPTVSLSLTLFSGLPLAALLVPLLASGARAGDFVGALRCRGCHLAAYEQWRQTPHANTFERLAADQRRDPRCTACHATSAEDALTGVQCESCHGAGRHYASVHTMKDTALARAVGLRRGDEPQMCLRCHGPDPTRLVPFDPKGSLDPVRHRPSSGAL